MNQRAMFIATGVVVAIALGLATWLDPWLAIAAAGLFTVAASVGYARVEIPVFLATSFLVLVLLPELVAIPVDIRLLSVEIYLPHLIAVALVPFIDWRMLGGTMRLPIIAYITVVGFAAMKGLFSGAAVSAVIQDLRGPSIFVAGLLAGHILYARPTGIRTLLIAAAHVIIASAVLVVVQLSTGLDLLGGRIEQARSLGGGGGDFTSATRFILNSEDLALVGLLLTPWLLTRADLGRRDRHLAFAVLLAGVIVMASSLSRQLIVGAAVGTVAWALVRPGTAVIRGMAGRAVAASVVATCVVLVLTLGGVGAGSSTFIGNQIEGFQERVLKGFGSKELTEDAGSDWRERENAEAWRTMREQPFGTGLGQPYRAEFQIESFGDPAFFRRFVHNVYLWYGTKAGLVGIVAVLAVTVYPLLHALRRARFRHTSDPIAQAAVPVLAAFCVMSLVDNVAINSVSGVITAVIVVLLGESHSRVRPAQESDQGQPI